MGRFRFDWRWIALIAVVALLANARSLPWPIITFALAAAGGYLLNLAWNAYSGGGGAIGGPRVTYWRGQRIETGGRRPMFRPTSVSTLVPVVVYGLIGLALLLAAVARMISGLGLG